MRRQYRGGCAAPDCIGQAPQITLETGNCIRVQHHRRHSRQRRQHHLPHLRANASSGPEDRDIAASIGQECRKFLRAVHRTHHHRQTCRRIDRQCLMRRGDGHDARARAQCPPCRKPRRAGRGDAARQHHRVAAPVFVAVELRPRKLVGPELWRVLECSRLDRGRGRSEECRYRTTGCRRNAVALAAAGAPACSERRSRFRRHSLPRPSPRLWCR